MTTRLRIEAVRRANRTAQSIGESFRHQREDAGLTQRQVAAAAGISQAHVAAIEAGRVVASIETLDAIALALGGDVSVKFYPGTGSRLRDRFQAPMVEAFIRILHPRWRRFPEVSVHRPASGVIDLVLADLQPATLVATEFQSQLRRLEQQIRWAVLKSEGLAAPSIPELIGIERPRIDRLLVLDRPRLREGWHATSRQRSDPCTRRKPTRFWLPSRARDRGRGPASSGCQSTDMGHA